MNDFKILSTCKLSESKELVVSLNKDNKYVIAKRFVVNDCDDVRYIYEKGSIIVDVVEFDKLLKNLYGGNITVF